MHKRNFFIKAGLIYIALVLLLTSVLIGFLGGFSSFLNTAFDAFWFYILAGMVIIISLIVAYVVMSLLSRNISSMSRQAEKISRGQYQQRIDSSGNNELARLASAVNRLAKNANKQLEEVRAERNQLSVILSNMVEGVLAIDCEQKVIHINDAASGLLQLDKTKVIAKPVWEKIRFPAFHQLIDTVFVNQDKAQGQVEFSRHGKDITIDLYATCFFDAKQQVLGAIIVLHDVSFEKKLESVRRDFVANASHELKTPVAAIRGMIETIQSDPQMPVNIRNDFVAKINRQTIRLTDLIQQLMRLSNIETSIAEELERTFDLSALCQQLILDMQPLAEKKGLKLAVQFNQEKLLFVGDEMIIQQMLSNLLDNAIKYTEQGQVLLTLAYQECHDTEDQFAPALKIAVSDTGEGISSMNQKRVFERFFRVDRARTRAAGGNGLGLSIVKNAVERHQGVITLQSEPGQGSCFTIELPASRVVAPV